MTDRFTIDLSPFNKPIEDIVANALRKTHKFPEGVTIIDMEGFYNGKLPPAPWAVIAFTRDWQDAKKVFSAGALDYIPVNTTLDNLVDEINRSKRVKKS